MMQSGADRRDEAPAFRSPKLVPLTPPGVEDTGGSSPAAPAPPPAPPGSHSGDAGLLGRRDVQVASGLLIAAIATIALFGALRASDRPVAQPASGSRGEAAAPSRSTPDVSTRAAGTAPAGTAPAAGGGSAAATAVATAAATTPARSPAPQAAAPTSAPTPAAAALKARVAQADESLRSGHLDVTIEYGEGTRSTAQIDFNLDGQEAGINLLSRYESAGTVSTTQRITIGMRSWDRLPNGRWVARVPTESVYGQLLQYRPRIAEQGAFVTVDEDGATLHIDEPGIARRAVLQVDPATGIPQSMREESTSSGVIKTITYASWNQPVQIVPPEG